MFAYQGCYPGADPLPPLSISAAVASAARRLCARRDALCGSWGDDEGGRSRAASCCSFTESRSSFAHNKRKGRRAPSMCKEPGTYLVIPPLLRGDANTLSVVLDLDETLAFGRAGPVVRRPHLDELLRFLGGTNCEVIVWTAGVRAYAQRLVAAIDPFGVVQHCVYRHDKWYPSSPYEGYTKNLALTGRHPDRTLIIDNTPDCLMRNAGNGIVCSDFTGPVGDGGDPTLVALRDIIEELAASQLPVPSFLARCEYLQLMSVADALGEEYEAYFLDLSHWGGPGLDTEEVARKTNRQWLNPDAQRLQQQDAAAHAAQSRQGVGAYSEIA